jgi:uncharacterized integral membrane protein
VTQLEPDPVGVGASPSTDNGDSELEHDLDRPKYSGVEAAPATAGVARRTRISTAWTGVVLGAVLLVLLLVFILQNMGSAKVSYMSAHGSLPLGVALLLAVVGGILLAGAFASLRILQLRRRSSSRRERTFGRMR